MNFGPFHFRQADRTLWRDSDRVHMTAKARDVLACLVAAQGRFVSKAEIMSTVWPDIHVLPDNVKVLIHEIRSVLEEDARNPQFICSEAGFGYAFVPERAASASVVPPERPQQLFLNRNRELAVLAEAFEDVRAGSSRVVILSGERGIGKTALSDVFLRLAAVGATLRTVRVRCRENAAEPPPLLPLIEVMQRLDDQRPAEEPRDMEALAPAWTALRSAADAVVPGLSSLIVELRAMLSSVARETPLIIVLEDLQWGDVSTHRVVGQLAGSDGGGKWLLIATLCEGGSGDARSASVQRLTRPPVRARVLNLEPLTATQVGRYLDARFGSHRLRDLTTALHDVTGGNPSMMVEAIDGLIANGVLPKDADDQATGVDMDAVINVLPYALRDAMSRQIDRLEPQARALLQAASLVEGEVTASAVAAVAATDVVHVKRAMASLAQRGSVLRRLSTSAAHGPDPVYRFQHPMYAHLLAEHAPVVQRFRASQRLGRTRERKVVRSRAHRWPGRDMQ